MLIPSRHAVTAAAGLTVLGVAVMALDLLPLWWFAATALLLLLVLDAILVLKLPQPGIRRDLPTRFALGSSQKVDLVIANHSARSLLVDLAEELPPAARAGELPWRGTLPPRRETRLRYPLHFEERGEARLGRTWVILFSPLRLWRRRLRLGKSSTTRVYPNYAPVLRLALLAIENRADTSGQLLKSVAGLSREFHQLRDFREGDALSQLDWKATARRRRLVSRDYEEQRDQTILFLLDAGRRMKALDEGLPQFDHALNAMLLLSWLALREGDQVGLLSFGETMRWLPPVKGSHSMPHLLEHLYDLQTAHVPSDYREAVEELMRHQKRRSMVILLSNLRGERVGDLAESLELLATRHHVLAASLREAEVERALNEPAQRFEDSLAAAAAAHYLEDRAQTLAALNERGVDTLEATAARFPIALAQRYLDAKTRGVI